MLNKKPYRHAYRANSLGETDKKYDTTAEHFAIFCEEVSTWLERLGLVGWRVEMEHDAEIDLRGNTLGYCEYYPQGRWATIGMNKVWCVEPDASRVREVAFHECCELMLCSLRTLANERNAMPDQVDEAVHIIIRTLENVLWAACLEDDGQDGCNCADAAQEASEGHPGAKDEHACAHNKGDGCCRAGGADVKYGGSRGLPPSFISRINARQCSGINNKEANLDAA